MGVVFECPSCGQSLRASDGDAGRSFKCTRCGVKVVVPAAGLPGKDAPRSPRIEYLTLGFQGKGLKGHIDKDQVTNTLNQHAALGWAVKTSSVAASGGYFELIVILEREVTG
jgi:DNA-directed RNA polymerase subunit RPC12/RpoP